MTDLVKKLTVASINGTRGGWQKPQERTFVARFAGRAAFVTEKSTQFGPYSEFGGTFTAWNGKGERTVSNKVILPEPAQTMVRAAIIGANNTAVDFAVDIFLDPDDDPRNSRGYQFSCVTVFENVDESLMRLEKELPALPIKSLK